MADYATENLTLDAMKGALKQQLAALVYATPHREAADQFSHTELPLGSRPPAQGRELPPAITQIALWPRLALGGAFPAPGREHQYERLGATLAGMEHKPTVILLYNRSSKLTRTYA